MQGQQEGSASGMNFSEREEGVVPEPGQYPTLHDVDADLHLGLIAGLGRAGGDEGKTIMPGEGRIGAIALRFIAVGPGHGRLEVIGDDDLGDATKGGTGPDMGADPVGPTLGPGRLGIGGVRGPKDRYEDRHFRPFPAVAVDHRNARPGVINTELLPRAVGLAQHQSKVLRPGSRSVTKPAVRQAVGRGRLLFLPQQKQRDALPCEFALDGGPIRHQMRGGDAGRDARKQPPCQRALIIGVGQGPR
jgi:hypothetical protein